MNIVVILASGLGQRMKAGKNKVLLRVGRKPILSYTISAFEENPHIHEIVLVARKEEIRLMKSIVAGYKFRKVKSIIEGGAERQHSAYNALKYLEKVPTKKKINTIVIHNGANPFVTESEISAVISAAKKYGASAIGHPAKDTIKEVDRKGMVVRTLERKKLWNMQTPQAIRFNLALRAFEDAKKKNFLGTDDVSLVEKIGGKVKVIEGSGYNFKITNPLDLELAKIIIKK